MKNCQKYRGKLSTNRINNAVRQRTTAPAIYEGEVAFISGVAENGTVVGNSYWNDVPALHRPWRRVAASF